MKKCILAVILLLTVCTMHAQLTNTRWKGAVKGDAPRNAVFAFSKDTAVVFQEDGVTPIEIMTYTFRGGVLTITKLAGQSDCAVGSFGKYTIKIKAGAMDVNLKEDGCDDRSSAIDVTHWVKIKG